MMVIWLLLFLILDLHGYIDPGTGSFILQLIIAGIAGGLYAIKVFWRQIVGIFSAIFRSRK